MDHKMKPSCNKNKIIICISHHKSNTNNSTQLVYKRVSVIIQSNLMRCECDLPLKIMLSLCRQISDFLLVNKNNKITSLPYNTKRYDVTCQLKEILKKIVIFKTFLLVTFKVLQRKQRGSFQHAHVISLYEHNWFIINIILFVYILIIH